MGPSDAHQPSDAELIAAAVRGDSESFGELCERHRARIWRVAASVADGADADDIAQEAVVRAWQALKRYRADAPFAAWLTRIAANVAHDCRKSAWRRRVMPLSVMSARYDARDDAEALALSRDEQRAIRQAVADLPERERSPIWLHYFEGFTMAEIARLSGAPEATVRSRARAGLKRLHKALAAMQVRNGAAQATGQQEAEQCST